MSPSDFKAWFAGYAETIDANGPSLNETQWNKLKSAVERMADDGLPAWVENPDAPSFFEIGKEQAKAD